MIFFNLLKFEMRHAFRRYQDISLPLWFLILIISVFSIGLENDFLLLQKSAPSIVWVSVLLTIMLSMNQLFMQDYHTGILEHAMLSPISPVLLIWVKMIGYWIKTCLPILACLPLLGLFLHLSFYELSILLFSLLLGTPILILLGTLGAALTLHLNNALLLLILILPLSIPVLIFGLSINLYFSLGLSFITPVCFLSAFLIMSCLLLPHVIYFCLRIGINS